MKEIKFGFDSYVRDGDTIWFTFPEIPAIGKFDCKQKKGTLEKLIPVTNAFADLYAFATIYNGQIIFLPFLDDKISIYDPETGNLSLISLPYTSHTGRICYWIVYKDYALVFSNMPEDSVLSFSYDSMSFQTVENMTKAFSAFFENESIRDFVARKGGDFILILDKKKKKIVFLNAHADQVTSVSLERLPYMPLDIFWIHDSVWLNTFESTSIFQLVLDKGEKLIEYSSESQEFILDGMHYCSYSSIAGWDNHIIAINSSKKYPSVVSEGRLIDLPVSDEYDCGLRGYGYGGMYSYAMPYDDELLILNYKSSRMLRLDDSMKIIEEIPVDIEIDDERWEKIQSEVFRTRQTLQENTYLTLKDFLLHEL